MKKVLLKRSASLVQGQPVLPTTSEIEYGELAVNYASGHETISMKNSNNQVVSFSSDEKFLDKVGLGHDEENDELYVRGLGGFTGDNYTTATSLQEVINDNEFVTAAALNELNTKKLDASAATDFMTSAQVETQITGKNYVTSAQVETQITGKNYATVSQIPNVGDYFDGAEYDSENVRINFKHGNTVKAYIDAAAFIKDGMVSDVVIDAPTAGTHTGVDCLIVTFNTDAEKSVIEIPLSEIFDPSNYYNKTEVDTEIERLEGMIEDDEYVISTAINDLNARKLDSSAITDFLTVEGLQDMGFVTTDDLENMGNTTSENLSQQAAQLGLAQTSALTELEQTVENNEYVTAVALNQLNADKLDASAATEFMTEIDFYDAISSYATTGYVNTQISTAVTSAVTSLTQIIEDNEYVIATALNNLNDNKLDTSAATDFATTAQVETQITGKGYITGYTETDPTVPSWAKAATRPRDVLTVPVTETDVNDVSTYSTTTTGTEIEDAVNSGKMIILKVTGPWSENENDFTLCVATDSGVEVESSNYYRVLVAYNAYTDNYTTNFGYYRLRYLIGSDPVTISYTYKDLTTAPDWNAVSGPNAILNKPTIPSTLDDIADGTTRKLSNYSLTSHTHSNYVTSGQVETQITGKNYVTSGQVETQVAGRVLPTVTAADNGKVLQVVNGAWALVTPSTVYTGENTPPSSMGNDGDIYLQTD